MPYRALLLSILTPTLVLAQSAPMGSGGVYGPRYHKTFSGNSGTVWNDSSGRGTDSRGGVGDSMMIETRMKSPERPRISEADSQACKAIHKELGYADDVANRYCANDLRVEKTLNPDFKECTSSLKAASGGDDLAPFCFYLDRAQTSQKTVDCLVSTLTVTKSSFWYLEDEQGMRNNEAARAKYNASRGDDDEFMSGDGSVSRSGSGARYHDSGAQPVAELALPFNMRQVLRECAHPVDSPASRNARVVGLAAYNPLLGLKGLDEGMGGLSGLTPMGANGIWSITDSKDHPVVHKFEFTVKENPTRVDIHYKGFAELKSAGLESDFEDLALLPNGELLTSTEVVSGGKQRLFGSSIAPSLLVKYDRNLQNPVAIEVPKELIPVIEQKQVPCPPPVDFDGWFNFFGFKSDGEKKKKAPPSNEICYGSVSQGIQFNKGLEGMSYDAASNSVFFAPEQPLAQDRPEPGMSGLSPLYRAKLNGSALGQTDRFLYAINTENDNGISAMLALNHDNVLVLERGFDRGQRRAIMKLFKVHLGTPNGQPLQKNLLIDFDGLRAQVPPGFQNLDNFEGIMLGPKLANGHRLLFFVSDDNFNPVQKTLLMTLEVGGLE